MRVTSQPTITLLAIYNGGAGAIFGLSLLSPWSTFSLSTSYDAMVTLSPEWVWGLAFLTIGLLQVLAHRLPYTVVWRFLMVAAFLYVAIMFAVGDYRSANWPNYAWNATWASGIFLVEAGEKWRSRKRARTYA